MCRSAAFGHRRVADATTGRRCGATAAAAIEAALQESERLIAASGARSLEPTLHEERARLAGVLGDAAGRERERRAALRLYTEMGATGHAERLAKEMGL